MMRRIIIRTLVQVAFTTCRNSVSTYLHVELSVLDFILEETLRHLYKIIQFLFSKIVKSNFTNYLFFLFTLFLISVIEYKF